RLPRRPVDRARHARSPRRCSVADEPNALTIRCDLQEVEPGKFRGTCIVPLHGPLFSGNSMLAAQSLSSDPAEAQHKAAAIIKRTLDSPVLQALMPPGTPIAIEAAAQLLHGLRSGDMQHVEHVLATVPDHMKDAMKGIVNGLKAHLPHLDLSHIL